MANTNHYAASYVNIPSKLRTFCPTLATLHNIFPLTNPELTRQTSALVTGHCPTNAYLFRFGLAESSICRFCHTDSETIVHLLFCCPQSPQPEPQNANESIHDLARRLDALLKEDG